MPAQADAPPPVAATAPTSVAEHFESSFEGKSGLKLFAQSWRPQGSTRAVVVLVHGLKDHSTRYAALANKLVAQGYAVHAFDLRGHAKSAGGRVVVDSFDDYETDLARFLELVRKQDPGRPIYLFGHSMGGAISTLYALSHPTELQGLLLSAPALQGGADVSPFLMRVTGFLGATLPGLPIFSLDNRAFSRDPKMVADMDHDPLVYQSPAPARTAAELLGAIEHIQQNMAQLSVPVLILHGTADRITNPEGSKALFARAGVADKTLKLYEGAFHDLLHEPEQEQVSSDILNWLDTHTQTAAPGKTLLR